MQTLKRSTSNLANLEENKMKLESLKENLRNLFDEIDINAVKKEKVISFGKG